VASDVFSLKYSSFSSPSQLARTSQKAPDENDVNCSLQNCGVTSVELAACHPSGAKNLGDTEFSENLCTPVLND